MAGGLTEPAKEAPEFHSCLTPTIHRSRNYCRASKGAMAGYGASVVAVCTPSLDDRFSELADIRACVTASTGNDTRKPV